MKKIALGLFAAANLFIANPTHASNGDGNEPLKFSNVGDTRFKVTFANTGKRSMLFIRDEAGRILYDEAVARNAQYTKVFDLSTLGDGKYTFEVSRGKEKFTKPFVISTQTMRSVNVIAD